MEPIPSLWPYKTRQQVGSDPGALLQTPLWEWHELITLSTQQAAWDLHAKPIGVITTLEVEEEIDMDEVEPFNLT